MKPGALPFRARADVARAVDYYASEAGPAVAGRFLAALDEGLRFIRDFPGAGSLRYASDSGHSNVRFWRLKRFPVLIFYREAASGIEVLRILHAARDIPASLRDPPDA